MYFSLRFGPLVAALFRRESYGTLACHRGEAIEDGPVCPERRPDLARLFPEVLMLP
jgi:hypothetical protein